jgi:hypothetical protein
VTSAQAPVWRTLAAAGLSTVLAPQPVFLLGGLAVLVVNDLAFSEVQLGPAASTLFSTGALIDIAAGRIAPLRGP